MQTFSAFFHSEGGKLFSGAIAMYQSNVRDIFTLSVLPGASCVAQSLIPSVESRGKLYERQGG